MRSPLLPPRALVTVLSAFFALGRIPFPMTRQVASGEVDHLARRRIELIPDVVKEVVIE